MNPELLLEFRDTRRILAEVAAIYAQHAALLEHIIASQPAAAPGRAYHDTVDTAIKAYLMKMMARVWKK